MRVQSKRMDLVENPPATIKQQPTSPVARGTYQTEYHHFKPPHVNDPSKSPPKKQRRSSSLIICNAPDTKPCVQRVQSDMTHAYTHAATTRPTHMHLAKQYSNHNHHHSNHRIGSHNIHDHPTPQQQQQQQKTPPTQPCVQQICQVHTTTTTTTTTEQSTAHAMNTLSYWALPKPLVDAYHEEGITSLYDWQVECMNNTRVLQGGNLVYSAPTGGGKTLVAEILMLRNILRTKRKAIFVLPFVSIVVEKVRYFTRVYGKANFKVKGFYSNKGCAGGLGRNCDIAICTIEKANSIVNRLIADNKLLSTIGVVVLDEMHMIGDGNRGYILELLLTKIRFVQEKSNAQYRETVEKHVNILVHNDGEMLSQRDDGAPINAFPPFDDDSDSDEQSLHRIQVVGLSATLTNHDVICQWLSATKYVTTYRPIPLKEYMKIDNRLYDQTGQAGRVIPMRGGVKRDEDRDQISALCAEVVQKKLSCIVFCHSKKGCQTLALKLSQLIPRMVVVTAVDKLKLAAARKSVLDKLSKCPFGLDAVLAQTVVHGIGYHHAGLTVEERSIVEDAFRAGALSVLTATSTLAAGVNLPARRVIFRNLKMGYHALDIGNYKQMAGRAGRAGKDTAGESVLCIRAAEKRQALHLMNAPLPPLESCLSTDAVGFTRLLNEAIASGIVQSVGDIEQFVKCTLFHAQLNDYGPVHSMTHKAILFLAHNKFIMWLSTAREWRATKLGLATFASSINPEDAITLYRDLERANRLLIFGDALHVLYLITPLPCYVDPQWQNYIDVYQRLSEVQKRIVGLIGLDVAFFNRVCMSAKPSMAKVKERVKQHNDLSFAAEQKEKQKQKQNSKPPKPETEKDAANGVVLTLDHKLVIAQRLWSALMVYDMVHDVPCAQIAHKFGVDPGVVQNLQCSVTTFAGMVSIFCDKLQWTELQLAVTEYQQQVQYGFQSKGEERKLKPFFKLGDKLMTKTIARVLYDAQITSVDLLAQQTADMVQSIVGESKPFQLRQQQHRRRDGIDPRLGLKLVVTAQRFMKRKHEARAKRMAVREQAVLDMSATQQNIALHSTPMPTQYPQHQQHPQSVSVDGHRHEPVVPKTVLVQRTPVDAMFRAHLHSVQPFSYNVANVPPPGSSVLRRKRFVPKKRKFDEVTPSQIFTPAAAPRVTQSVNANANEKSEKAIDSENEYHHETDKQAVAPTITRDAHVDDDDDHAAGQTVIDACPGVPTVTVDAAAAAVPTSHEPYIDPAMMEVFADFLSPTNFGDISIIQPAGGADTKTPTLVIEFGSKSPALSNRNDTIDGGVIQEPPLKKRKLSHPDVHRHSQQIANACDNHAMSPLSHSQSSKRDKNVHNLNQSQSGTAVKVFASETPVDVAVSSLSCANTVDDVLPETPTTPFGDCASFEKNVSTLLSARATMCDLFIPGIMEISEDNRDDEFVRLQHTTTNNSNQTNEALANNGGKQEMCVEDGDGDGDGDNNAKRGSVDIDPDISIMMDQQSNKGNRATANFTMATPCHIYQQLTTSFEDELENELWAKSVPQCVKKMDVDADKSIPFVPLVIDVFVNEQTYGSFISKWRTQRAFVWSVWGKFDQLNSLTTKNVEVESLFAPKCAHNVRHLSRSQIGGFSIAWSSKRSYIIELNHVTRSAPPFVCKPTVWRDIADVFESAQSIKISYNSKKQLQILRKIGIGVGGKVWDPRLAHWLIEPDIVSHSSFDMDTIFTSWCPKVWKAQRNLLRADREVHAQLLTVPPDKQALSTIGRKHGLYTWKMWLCMHFMVRTLYRRRLLRAFILVETKLIAVLTDMEYHGIGFDTKRAKQYELEMSCKIEHLQTMAHALVAQSFNLASPKECSHVLYNVLKLPPPPKAVRMANNKQKQMANNKQKPVQLSCNGEILEQLADKHPLPRLLIEYRTLSRFLQTYVEPLPRMTALDKQFQIERIHSSVLQTSTATGRLAMAWPNLQSINKSINFEPVPRYSVWEELQHTPDLRQVVSRLNVDPKCPELQVMMANCVDRVDKACATKATTTTEEEEAERSSASHSSYMRGTLQSIAVHRTVQDAFPGGQSLLQYWSEKGHRFAADNVAQVVVKVKAFNGGSRSVDAADAWTAYCEEMQFTDADATQLCGVSGGGGGGSSGQYTYPADKVWRLNAFEKMQKHARKDALVSAPTVDRSVDLYPFKAINFSPRSSFIAPPHYVLLAADYSQIELRILAHFADDSRLISAMRHGLDVMRDVASSITGTAYDCVTDEERQRAKSVVYGMLYGQTCLSLAAELKIEVRAAKDIVSQFKDKYPKSAAWLHAIVQECRQNEFITTVLGRKRYLPHIRDAQNVAKRQQAERQAVNSVCQGSAADLIKVAMIKICDELKRLQQQHFAPQLLNGAHKRKHFCAKLVLQIHDELLFEVKEDQLDAVASIVKCTMENCIKLKVPLQVKMKVGRNWGTMQPYEHCQQQSS